MGQLLHHGPGRQHIQVHKIARVIVAKVGVAQVAAARNAQGVVGNEQLVVHALLHPREVAHQAENAPQLRIACTRQRVEHAHFHIGHKGQPHHLRVSPGAVQVVQQHAHPHTTFCGGHHALQQPLRAHVGMDGVVLQIQRLLCRFHQRQPAAVGRLCAAEQHESRRVASFGGSLLLLHHAGQRRAGRVGQRAAYGAINVLWQTRAARECHANAHRDQQRKNREQPESRWALSEALNRGGGRVHGVG